MTFNGTTLTITGLSNTGNTTLGDASADTLTINSTITSNLIFTDNTYDIGASGATRPRTLYLGTSLITPAITNSGLTSGRVVYTTTGGLETSSANLLYSGTDLTVYGLTVGRGAGAVSTNTAVGASALAANTTGLANTAIGYQAGNAVTSAGEVSLFGYNAGKALTTGYGDAFGSQALSTSTTGTNNSAFGYYTLKNTTTGSYNTAVGFYALTSNTTASNNTAVGYQAFYSTTTTGNNTGLGYKAGYANTTGANNVLLGTNAGVANTTGSNNTIVGKDAYQAGTTASDNAGFGWQVLYNTTGSGNTAVGSQAMQTNSSGTENTAAGQLAMFSNTTGISNSGFGRGSLYSNSTGSYNTGLGHGTLQNNTTASNNTAVGYQAMYSATTGPENTAFGKAALYSLTTGRYNVAVGQNAGVAVTTADGNTFIGLNAGLGTTGANNTFVGALSAASVGCGQLVTTGSKNTILGSYNGNQGGLDIRTASNYIVLSDGDGNPRGIFDSSGNFLVGVTSASYSGATRRFVAEGSFSSAFTSTGGSGNECVLAWNTATSGDNTFAVFKTEGGSGLGRGSITYNRGAGLVAYNVTSDYRAKDIIGPVTDSGVLIDSVPVYMGKMKGATQERPMFIAHETPEYAHTGEKDAVDGEGNPIFQQMDASSLVPVLWAEVQSLRQRVAQLESN
jgi:hypothetical protein